MGVAESIAAAIETISDGFALLDADYRFLIVNAPFRRLYPGAEDTLDVGGSYAGFVRRMAHLEGLEEPGAVDAFVSDRMALLENPGPPYERHMCDGRWIRIADYRAADGGTVCLRRDITERKERERALAESEDRFRRLSEITFEAVLILQAGVIVDHNRAALKISGYSSEELIGRSTLSLLAPEYHDIARDRMANRDESSYRAIGVRKDGARLPVELYSRHIEYGGKTLRVVTVRDIRQQLESERALAENEARMRAVIEGALDAIVTIDESGLIVEFNPAAEQIFGFERGAVLGKPVGETIVPHEQRARHHEGMARYVETGEKRLIGGRIEVEALRSDGSLFPAELTMTELRLGEKRLFTAFIRDLTEARRLEREMADQRERLHQSHKLGALGSLLAGVAHELNNPLSIVVAQAMLLEETATDERTLDRGRRIRTAAERCDKIVKSFLAMARQKRPQRIAVDVARVVDDVLGLVSYGLRSSGIEVVCDVPADLPPVWADPDQLNQVLTNLVVNAQQAMMDLPGAHRIVLSAECEGPEMSITVSDNGPGVPVEIRDRVFDPFFTTKPVGLGTGVGLAVCHGIIDSYGGSISIEDAPGGGARFRVRLPVGAPAGEAVPVVTKLAPAVEGRRVLVVDDEPEIASTMREILEAQGHRVDTAENGAAALALVERNDYDLILSDLRMPGMSGPELYRRLRDERPTLARRMIVVTGDTLNGAARVFLQESGLPKLEKPFGPAEVRRVVAEALTRDEPLETGV